MIEASAERLHTMKPPNRYYTDPDTLERLLLTYRVHFSKPATSAGYVDIEATSENEAVELALADPWTDGHWEFDHTDCDNDIEVCEVWCDDPPEDALLMETNGSEATLDGVLWPSPEAESTEERLNGSNDKG